MTLYTKSKLALFEYNTGCIEISNPTLACYRALSFEFIDLRISSQWK